MSDSTVDGFIPWVLAGIASMIAALTSAVTYLTKTRFSEYAKEIEELKTRSDACEKDRSDLFAKHAVLANKVENLQSKLSRIDVDGTQFSHKEKQ